MLQWTECRACDDKDSVTMSPKSKSRSNPYTQLLLLLKMANTIAPIHLMTELTLATKSAREAFAFPGASTWVQ